MPRTIGDPFQTGINPQNATESAISFAFSLPQIGPIQSGPFNRPYLNVVNGVASWTQNFLNMPQWGGSSFGSVRSVLFNYRPLWNGQDFQNLGALTPMQQYASVVIFNQRTLQILAIKPSGLGTVNLTLTGTTTSYVPTDITVQGARPFFASLQDTIEIATYGAGINPLDGFLTLTFMNHDVNNFTDTLFGGLTAFV